MAKLAEHRFALGMRRTFEKADSIGMNRGGQYDDTWAIETYRTPWQDMVEREWREKAVKAGGLALRLFKRQRTLAALIDTKYSRLGGPRNEDTELDTVNYVAAFYDFAQELIAELRAAEGAGIAG